MKYLICLAYSLVLLISFRASAQISIQFKTSKPVYLTGESIQFKNISSKEYADSTFKWDFSDDCGMQIVYDPLSCIVESKGLESVAYTYHKPGKYLVSLYSGKTRFSKVIEIIADKNQSPQYSAKEYFDNNLVTNSGFESFTRCPELPGQLYLSSGWFSPTSSTPDYFNSCFSDKTVFDWEMDVPRNFAGTTYAKDGGAFVGIINFIAEDSVSQIRPNPGSKYYNYREYIETKLNKPVEKGQTYAIQFYVKMSSKSRVSAGLGMFLSPAEISRNSTGVLSDLQPQIYIDEITDTAWMLVADTFIAGDHFEYLLIGNFKDDQHANLRDLRPDSIIISNYGNFKAYASYCYIDAVTVSHIFNESQERFTIASAGGTFTGSDVMIDFTVGQRAFQTYTTNSVILTQGFQQPDENDITFRLMPASSLKLNTIEIAAYPNPFYSKVQIQIKNKLQNDVTYEIFDFLGHIQSSGQFRIHDAELFSYELDLAEIPSGIYFLRISNNNDTGTYKLIKQ